MPAAVFMERDARRDHLIGRPDPEGAAAIGAPDACTRCHTRPEETPAWAATWVRRWWGPSAALVAERERARTFHAARQGDPAAVPGLLAVLGSDVDTVRRASAARLLGDHTAAAGVIDALVRAAGDRDPVVRAGAVQALGDAASTDRRARAALLGAVRDPVRLVRVEAGFGLRQVDLATVPAAARAAVAAAFAAWLAAQDLLAELPETHFNRGLFLIARGEVAAAEAAYRTAIRLWPADLTPRQNLALLLAETGRTAEAEAELREILAREPAWPPAAFALGLLYAGEERWREVADSLEACRRRDPAYPRAAYNLGLAYRRLGEEEAAAAALTEATRDPAARAEALRELVRLASVRGDEAALRHWLPAALLAAPTVRADPRVRAALGDGPEAVPPPPNVP
jgi:tetratricopeptide (TPR) repeat protein